MKPARLRTQLAARLDQHLVSYALVAGAAAVGGLAFSPTANAEVIFTPAHVTVNPGDLLYLDLNHDGVNDFRLIDSRSGFFGLNAIPQTDNNAVIGTNVFTTFNAEPLRYGFLIGPQGKFQSTPALLAASFHSSSGQTFRLGKWLNVRNRYLGLRFDIGGQVHFGWARLSVRSSNFSSTALVTGYAYESVAEQPIRAGQRSTANPGQLALGAAGL